MTIILSTIGYGGIGYAFNVSGQLGIGMFMESGVLVMVGVGLLALSCITKGLAYMNYNHKRESDFN